MFISILLSAKAFGQDNTLYKAAFKYIIEQNKGKEVIVSDTLTGIELAEFNKDLGHEWGENIKETEKIVDSIEFSSDNHKLADKELKKLHTAGQKPKQIIFFSIIRKNVFIGEIMGVQEKDDLKHYDQSFQNQSKRYLFVIDDKDKTVRFVASKVIAYN